MRVDLAIDHFEAVDGLTLQQGDPTFSEVFGPGSERYTPGARGSALSHLRLWQSCLEQGQPILIFEDDAIIRHDINRVAAKGFETLHRDWDVILFGYNTDSILTVDTARARRTVTFPVKYPSEAMLLRNAMSTSAVAFLRLHHAFGLCGYAISPKGARILSKLCFPLDNRVLHITRIGRLRAITLGGMMNAAFSKVRAFACYPPVVLSPNDKATSTID
jgi:GR25 family glycosyltransferase involved in LPS biosynthesis